MKQVGVSLPEEHYNRLSAGGNLSEALRRELDAYQTVRRMLDAPTMNVGAIRLALGLPERPGGKR